MAGTSHIEIVGRACRLPGAPSCEAFWRLLVEQRCAVTAISPDRWSLSRYWSPRRGERGKSYTFAAGVLDDIWGFDPGPFGMSPREAEQMDPQQRILLQVVWEALENAGLRPSSLAGQQIGVYVGVSSLDNANRRLLDPAGADAYLMTGNTLSLVANRISYIFDWHGPSFGVDTACSSSLVALAQAVEALRSGQIEVAVVGGVNVLLSPFPYIGFAAAQMLAPDGRCRPFDAKGQGYVRSEGSVALILRRADAALPCARAPYAEIVDAGVNSDGKTTGVSLPSSASQGALLRQLYERSHTDPNDLAFVEAHGTGTRVGDPAEALAIGRNLGQHRRQPLLVGSVKSNVGHLEPAAGLTGVLKALLALENDLLPASLAFETPNPDIPFADLNLKVASEATPLPRGSRPRYAGVSAFGFGGTNAHAILKDPGGRGLPLRAPVPRPIVLPKRPATAASEANRPGTLLLTAHCADGLQATAAAYAQRIEDCATTPGRPIEDLTGAIVRYREAMPERLAVVASSAQDAKAALDSVLARRPLASVVTGRAVEPSAQVAFVYSGNGSQWPGMGRLAYALNPLFRRRLDEVSAELAPLTGWSLTQLLHADDLGERLKLTSVAQPLLLAIQIALTDALAAYGLSPTVVLGHSVGEVSAAYASGALSLPQALRVIVARSTHQELARGLGTMAALALGEEEAAAALKEAGCSGIEIAGINSPKGVTLAGSRDDISRFEAFARQRGLLFKVLDLDYPFHCDLVSVARDPLLKDLRGLTPVKGHTPFLSTVKGEVAPGAMLDAAYWWHNVRQPVRFAQAVRRAAELGARVFVEIGPRAILQTYVADSLAGLPFATATVAGLGPQDPDGVDPVRRTLARALVRGARYDVEKTFPILDQAPIDLPSYPWQNRRYAVAPTTEASTAMLPEDSSHPLLGWREREGSPVWYAHLDTNVTPALADHKVGGQPIMPGAGLAEMALAAARSWLGTERVEIADLDILTPLPLSDDHMREVRTSLDPATRSLEIASRRRLSDEGWQVHVLARFAAPAQPVQVRPAPALSATQTEGPTRERFYREARKLGLDYGPCFRRLAGTALGEGGTLEVAILPRDAGGDATSPYLLDPMAVDAAFQGLLQPLLIGTEALAPDALSAFVPVRIGSIRLETPGRPVHNARIRLLRRSPIGLKAEIELFDDEGRLVAVLGDVRFRAGHFSRRRTLAEVAYHLGGEVLHLPGSKPLASLAHLPSLATLLPEALHTDGTRDEEARLLAEAGARRAAFDAARTLFPDGTVDTDLLARQRGLTASQLAAVATLLGICESAGLARCEGTLWVLADETSLPPLDTIVQTALADHPQWWADWALIAHARLLWPELLAAGREMPAEPPYAPALLESFLSASPRLRTQIARLTSAVEIWLERRGTPGPGAAPRILELGLGSGALTRALAPLLARHNAQLTALDSDPRVAERLRATGLDPVHVDIADTQRLAEGGADLGPFDLVVSADNLHRQTGIEKLLARLPAVCAPGALLLASASRPDAFHDFVFALARGPAPQASAESLLTAAQWTDLLTRTSSIAAHAHTIGDDTAPGSMLLVGDLARRLDADDDLTPATPERVRVVEIVTLPSSSAVSDLAGALRRALPSRGLKVSSGRDSISAADARDVVILTGPGPDTGLAPTSTLVTSLRTELLKLAGAAFRVWIVAPGGVRASLGLGDPSPAQTAVWAFARTAQNELTEGDVRLVDFEAALTPAAAAEAFAQLIAAPGTESEVVLGHETMTAVRARRGVREAQPHDIPAAPAPQIGARLRLNRGAGGERISWERTSRRAPEPHEVEIEVAATGLNFRDAMWSLGLLPEEALEDGFAGPTLGFECTGHVVRAGKDVKGLAVGDAVIAFAPAAFASHVTVTTTAVARLPDGVSLESAASIPVTFLTAYYALHNLAGLREGEWLLVHGGAGGVGLAALQIALASGARIIATAGSQDRRELLRLLGADHVLDSRSLAFHDDVMRLTGGEGVDVVLNSLAGEAMERSLDLVKPFGRFLELGKRDFYGHTKISLRPFRRNVSYHGIDADQLLSQRPELTARLFSELMELFARGELRPLPYRVFPATAVADAFRLIQHSGHVGKIVVAPPKPHDVPATRPPARFEASADGAHVIVGGLGGFGLATARWLAEHGARSLVLVGRSGKPSPESEPELAALASLGVAVRTAAVDATDEQALDRLLKDVRRQAPIRGVVHAAMVIDDEFLARTSSERIHAVLSPKIAAAHNLDRLTRTDRLDYFVLYSSVTTLIGNPAQGAYVAANGYLEGLARQRRTLGLPALAVGWGGITDTGYLKRNAKIGEAIKRRTGAKEFTAAEALDHLGELLAEADMDPASAAFTIAPMTWSSLQDQLALLRRPLFRPLLRGEAAAPAEGGDGLDLAAAIKGMAPAEARDLAARHLAAEVARIFRMPLSDVAADRPLSELGMDSLMGLELRMAVQQRLGAELPLAAISSTLTLNEIAAKVVASLTSGAESALALKQTDADLARQHLTVDITDIGADKMGPLLRELERREAKGE